MLTFYIHDDDIPVRCKYIVTKQIFDTIGTFCSIQHYVIKFVRYLRQVDGLFSPGTPVSSTNKTDHHDITEILLQVALNIPSVTATVDETIIQKSNI
jgi:hypothetical protein